MVAFMTEVLVTELVASCDHHVMNAVRTVKLAMGRRKRTPDLWVIERDPGRVWTPPKMQAKSLLIMNNVVRC